MRFVFISAMSGCPWGGSEELWSQSALCLRNQGHAVSALVPWWPQPAAQLQMLIERGIKVRMGRPNVIGLGIRVWRKFARQFGCAEQEQRWLLRQGPDLVCISNGNYSDGLAHLEFCANHELAYTSVVQANLESVWPDDRLAERLLRVYQKARRVFFVSKRNRTLLEKQLGIALENTEVIRNPFNVRWNANLPWPQINGKWRMACVARLEPPAKGQDLLFEVLSSEPWCSRPVEVSLFGKGEMEQGMRRLAKYYKLGERVKFCGHIADIEQLWSEHHILVLPSRYEGLPLALVEAMLCGRPAIVTDVAGNSEMIEDGVSGFVAAAPNAQHLQVAMERAWEKRSEWQNMGAIARKTAQAKVCEKPAEVFAEKLLRLTQQPA